MMLAEFLRQQAGNCEPWHCSTLPADWCVALGDPDPAAEWRHLSGVDECAAEAAAGLVPLWERGVNGRYPEAVAPYQPGDIAVVSLAGTETGAIYTGERWAVRTDAGISTVPLRDRSILKAWRPWAR